MSRLQVTEYHPDSPSGPFTGVDEAKLHPTRGTISPSRTTFEQIVSLMSVVTQA